MVLGVVIKIVVIAVILMTEGCTLLQKDIPQQSSEYWAIFCTADGTRIIISNNLSDYLLNYEKCP